MGIRKGERLTLIKSCFCMWFKIQISSRGFRSLSNLSNLPSFFPPSENDMRSFQPARGGRCYGPCHSTDPCPKVRLITLPSCPWTHLENHEVLAVLSALNKQPDILLLPLQFWAMLACSDTQPAFSSTNLLGLPQARLVPGASQNSCLQIFFTFPYSVLKTNLYTPYIILNRHQKIFIICLISCIFCDAYRLCCRHRTFWKCNPREIICFLLLFST